MCLYRGCAYIEYITDFSVYAPLISKIERCTCKILMVENLYLLVVNEPIAPENHEKAVTSLSFLAFVSKQTQKPIGWKFWNPRNSVLGCAYIEYITDFSVYAPLISKIERCTCKILMVENLYLLVVNEPIAPENHEKAVTSLSFLAFVSKQTQKPIGWKFWNPRDLNEGAGDK
ncbi:hypothetical protein Glove_386g31 [Diversispora epigaea]|uniref:Uncharacterized protein n=1 Tax=Diversispora epigaea TaxID=1348612 RepID=A0A397H786_9GLOM|nr:hypothetical protein Glove_386g31 [Diversispora epigaea]